MISSVEELEERALQNELCRYSLDDTDMMSLTQITEEEEAMAKAVAGESGRTRVTEPAARAVLERAYCCSAWRARGRAHRTPLTNWDEGARLSEEWGDEGEWALFFIELVDRSNVSGTEPVGMDVLFDAIAWHFGRDSKFKRQNSLLCVFSSGDSRAVCVFLFLSKKSLAIIKSPLYLWRQPSP